MEQDSAFAAVALPHLDAAYNLARWLTGSADEAEDVVQEAMVRALTYFPSFRGGNPRAWVLQIVRNAAYAALKTRHGAGRCRSPPRATIVRRARRSRRRRPRRRSLARARRAASSTG